MKTPYSRQAINKILSSDLCRCPRRASELSNIVAFSTCGFGCFDVTISFLLVSGRDPAKTGTDNSGPREPRKFGELFPEI